MRFSD